MCWAFDTVPSRIDEVFWGNSYGDLKLRLKLKLGSEQAKFVQEYQTMALLMKQMFGGEEDNVQPPQNVMQAQAQLAAVLGGG